MRQAVLREASPTGIDGQGMSWYLTVSNVACVLAGLFAGWMLWG